MPDPKVTSLRPRAAGYSDTAALDDVHAIMTAADGRDALADIGQVLTLAGRPLVAVRVIEVSTRHTALGWPVAQARARTRRC
jgi:hypothetical protein